MTKLLNIPDDWYSKLEPFLRTEEFLNIGKTIALKRQRLDIFPLREEVFRAFQKTPLKDVKCVILGQDPYPNLYKHEPVACGLSFCPRNSNYLPPSLRIIKEKINTSYESEEDIDIVSWAEQGVLMLNTALTVEHGRAGSHSKLWEPFTQEVFKVLNESSTGVIYLLWGKEAQVYEQFIGPNNYVLKAAHPVSAVYRGNVWDCNHFIETNEILNKNFGKEAEINWLAKRKEL
jgi:uracil-DNA glycosylase